MAECRRPIIARKSAERCASGLRQLAGERADVAAGHEMLAGPLDHDDAQASSAATFGRGGDQRVHQREVERVERLRTVER